MKYLTGIALIIGTILITGIILKPFWDSFCIATTGPLAVAGMPENEIAWWALVPWLIPIIVCILIIKGWMQPDEPDDPRNYQ